MQGTASPSPQAPGRFLSVEGHTVHFVDLHPNTPTNGRAPVVMVHGANGSVYDYLLSPIFPKVRDGRRVILIDRMARGFSRQSEGTSLTLVDQARIMQQILDELGVRRPVIVGHSLGSAVTLAHGVEYQDRAAGYVLLAPIAYGLPGLSAAVPVLGRPAVAGLVSKLLLLNIRLYSRAVARIAFAPNYDCMPPELALRTLEPLPEREQVVADWRNFVAANHSLLEMAQRYQQITAPTIVLAGAKDGIARLENQAGPLAQALARTDLRILQNTGHMVHFVHPAEVLDAIELVEAQAAARHTGS